MPQLRLFSFLLVLTSAFNFSPSSFAADSADNQLTTAEKAGGWQLLFDGHSLTGWRSYAKTNGPAKGWVVENGLLNCVAGARGGDIVSTVQFTDFDLQWDWRIPALANNGVKYLVNEHRSKSPGHEYQMLDDITLTNHPKETTASFYAVIAPAPDKPLHPVGEWNHSRVLVQGNHVEHWLNGAKVVEYELGSPELKAAIAESKFKNEAGFADKITGPIMLTEHHDAATYKNIKIRDLSKAQ